MTVPNFPRILFVTPVAFNPYAGGGATFSSLFRGWPKDRLATIHNDATQTSDDVCELYFKLTSRELDLVWPFNMMRGSAGTGRTAAAANDSTDLPDAQKLRSLAKDRLRLFLFGDSLPETAQLTPELKRWISNYQPDVLYTILGSNGMMSLIEKIRIQFKLPLVVHIMDDWASSAHHHGIFAPIEYWRMRRWLKHFFKVAIESLGISPAMCDAYAERYGRPFSAFQYALEMDRWSGIEKGDLTAAAPPEFLYVGSIFREAQLDSLVDCAKAVADLNNGGFAARFNIITSKDNAHQFGRGLELHPNIRVLPPIPDERLYFSRLAVADVLLLPINFDQNSVDFVRYSMPTKIPAYLKSGTPVLVYGPAETAQVRYAMDNGWGHVVAHRSLDELKNGMKEIVQNSAIRQSVSASARATALNHDARVVRSKFQELLCYNVAGTSPSI
jgi:glycosyltransferase involved in cell wall biosynthesis